MRLLITGACGFVGSMLAESLLERLDGACLVGIDNLMRPGAETNRRRLERLGVRFVHGDLRSATDVSALPPADWVIDAAANPSVLAGVDRPGASRALFEHNLVASGNVLEYCRAHRAGLVLLSTSRVYSIPALAALPLSVHGGAFAIDPAATLPPGVSAEGIDVSFSTDPPVSLYGATKRASELLALEYGAAFDFPVWVVRSGVLAGAGQFGRPDQGIFAYWINAHLRQRALHFTGFGGTGHQVRDAMHPRDLAALLVAQMRTPRTGGPRIYTAGGGRSNAMSLAQLAAWCDERFGARDVEADPAERRYDIPWVVMDNHAAAADFGWRVETPLADVLDGIGRHAVEHPDWLDLSGA